VQPAFPNRRTGHEDGDPCRQRPLPACSNIIWKAQVVTALPQQTALPGSGSAAGRYAPDAFAVESFPVMPACALRRRR